MTNPARSANYIPMFIIGYFVYRKLQCLLQAEVAERPADEQPEPPCVGDGRGAGSQAFALPGPAGKVWFLCGSPSRLPDRCLA